MKQTQPKGSAKQANKQGNLSSISPKTISKDITSPKPPSKDITSPKPISKDITSPKPNKKEIAPLNSKQTGLLKPNSSNVPSSSKKLSMLKTLNRSTPLLCAFSEAQLLHYQRELHVLVFSKGHILIREGELSDFIGVVIEGHLRLNQLIGQVEGLHRATVVAAADGVMVALRIEDLLRMEGALRTRIYLEVRKGKHGHCLQMRGEEKDVEVKGAFGVFLHQLPSDQSNKIMAYFPSLGAKQKDLIAMQSMQSYLLFVMVGSLVAKREGEANKVIVCNEFFNERGFITNCTPNSNIYCQSEEAVYLLMDREMFLRISSPQTQLKLFSLLEGKEERMSQQVPISRQEDWNMFKQYQIVPLKRKPLQKPLQNKEHRQESLSTHQTLFKEQLGQERNKTQQSVLDKIYTLKTQAMESEGSQPAELQYYKKMVEELNSKLLDAERRERELRSKLTVSVAKNNMAQVLRQLRKVSREEKVGEEEKSNAISLLEAVRGVLMGVGGASAQEEDLIAGWQVCEEVAGQDQESSHMREQKSMQAHLVIHLQPKRDSKWQSQTQMISSSLKQNHFFPIRMQEMQWPQLSPCPR